jgi:glucose/mannose-6-phosphate isomerase
MRNQILLKIMDDKMIDDIKYISKIDKFKMIDTLYRFPEQINETIDIVNESDVKSIFKVNNIIISGMGGSAISGDILQRFFRTKLDIPIFVNREYNLPKWANKNTLILSQSYSGNTEETLSNFKQATQKKCKIIGFSSGGKLQDYCKKRDISFIKIPSGYAPRAATSYLLFSAIMAIKKTGILKYDIEPDIKEAIEISNYLRSKINKKIPKSDNLAKQIATKILNTIPQIYGWEIYYPIAKRWSTQFNENSKIIAKFDSIPECNHNDIVGWSNNKEISKKFTCLLFRDEKIESIYITKRLNFMKKLFNETAADVIEINIKGKKNLSKMMYAMYLGDFVSCYLAILRKIDPSPVDIIIELKDELSKI